MEPRLYDLLDRCPPIFVTGCSHCGTTLMNAIIGAHSKIHPIEGETKLFTGFVKGSASLMLEFYDMAVTNNKCRWTEKTAEHIFYMDNLLAVDTAKVVIIVRDGRDVAYSKYMREGKIRDGITLWKSACQIALRYSAHPRTILVRYEDLITDFEYTMTKVFEFLGEKYEDGVVNFYKHRKKVDRPPDERDGSGHRQNRAWQLGQPLFDGRGRYKDFNKMQLDYVLARQKNMLLELGYIQEAT